jgi:hypothetical protein
MEKCHPADSLHISKTLNPFDIPNTICLNCDNYQCTCLMDIFYCQTINGLDKNGGLLSTSSAYKNQKKTLNNSPHVCPLSHLPYLVCVSTVSSSLSCMCEWTHIQDKEDGIDETVNTHTR